MFFTDYKIISLCAYGKDFLWYIDPYDIYGDFEKEDMSTNGLLHGP